MLRREKPVINITNSSVLSAHMSIIYNEEDMQ